MNIIIVAGMPASGKTTFVNKLSKALGYPVLEKDAIKEAAKDRGVQKNEVYQAVL